MTAADLPFIAEAQARLERLSDRVEYAERAWMKACASHSKSKRLFREWKLLKARRLALEARYG